MRKKKRGSLKRYLWVFFRDAFLLIMSAGFLATGAFLLWATSLEIPDFSALEDRKEVDSTTFYDRTGEVLLYDMHTETKRTDMPFNEISRHIKSATVAIEDAEFYDHIGIRPLAFLRAILKNIQDRNYSQGGSTITQQVVKNALLTPEKTVARKLKEWIISIKVERAFSKEEILAMYLNESPYGGNIYGVEEASLAFFGKHASDVTLTEAAYLAALPQAPTYYSPYGSHREGLDARKNRVLGQMLDLGFIRSNEYLAAMQEEVIFKPRANTSLKAPHFVMWVLEELVQRYGERAVLEGGFKVVTTIDYDLQSKAEDIITRYGEENELKYNATNAGMVGIDPRTGEVLIMVGSRDYFEIENDGNFNVTLAHRQPGSAFKPFVYATAFKEGYLPETVVFDVKTNFQTTCDAKGVPLNSSTDPSECYVPRNYDNVYRGPVSLRNALAQSINVPAIKALYLVGINDALETAQTMGVTSIEDASQYGLTLVLGGGEVTLLEMTSAYGVFANDGVRTPHSNILRIENLAGETIYTSQVERERVLPKQVARQISDVLSDNVARTPAFGSRSYLYFDGRDVAAKTGTTNDYRDAWIIGYTPSISLGTWVGNNDASSMEKKVAGFIVAPMWNAVMQEILATTETEVFPEADITYTKDTKPILRGVWKGGFTYEIDSISGKLATKNTPDELKEERTVMNVHNILYWIEKNNPRGLPPKDPKNDPQFSLWEEPVNTWAQSLGYTSLSGAIIPTEYDDVHIDKNKPIVSITSLKNGSTIDFSNSFKIELETEGSYPVERVDYFINNTPIGSIRSAPYSITFRPRDVSTLASTNTLKVVVYDSVLNKTTVTSTFKVNIPQTQ